MKRQAGLETEVSLQGRGRWVTVVAMTVRRSYRPGAALALATALAAALAWSSPASAMRLGADLVRRGACDPGPSHWKLRVFPGDAGMLIVRFALEGGDPGHTWNLFLDRNGTGFFAGSRVSGELGFVRVSRRTPDAPGTDIIRAAGHDVTTGEICRGRVRL
jgi:hypothetical protein